MNRKKPMLLTIAFSLIALTVAGIYVKNHTRTQIKELFRMNKELQEDGYYMADFEFKMMGMAYWLDKGDYYRALTRLDKFHKQLKTKEGLLKVPKFAGKADELEFYLNLQNPKTGAFMDDSYPYCTYNEVTENVLGHLSELTKETGQPLRLKYPLKYLDEINTPDTLRIFLNDVSNVGWVASKFPQTTFVFARSMLSYYNGEGVIRENKLYDFSPEWKQALLQWFYDNQDPQTGFWGPKSRVSGKMLRKDLTNTASIIKTFVDGDGNNIHGSFPLRYRNEMFKTALDVMSQPMPDEDDLDEWHEWALKMGKGVALLTRYLWNDASPEEKMKARELLENFVKVTFRKYYVPVEGAFCLYPDSKHATLDGTGGNIRALANIGYFSTERQKRLWGDQEGATVNLGEVVVSNLTEKNLESIGNAQGVNSVRIYSTVPGIENCTSGVLSVFYPKETAVLDVMELAPKVKKWLDDTSQSMGNWVSKETTAQKMESLKIDAVPVYRGKIPVEWTDEALRKDRKLTLIGFDILQIPRYKLAFVLN
jgi:hypothetical protein